MGFRRFGTPRSVGSAVNAAPAPPSTPDAILTGMVLEMDANNVEAIAEVYTWYGNPVVGTPDVDQPDGAFRALFGGGDPNFNGEPSAIFSGSTPITAKYYETTALSGLTQGEVFAVLINQYALGAYPSDKYTGLWQFGSDTQNVHVPYTDSNVYDSFGTNLRKNYGNMSGYPWASPHIYNVSSAAGAYTARFNGAQIFTTATNTVGFPATARFGATASGVYVFNGRLAYLVVCNQVQTPTARAQMHTYLSQRFGITLS